MNTHKKQGKTYLFLAIFILLAGTAAMAAEVEDLLPIVVDSKSINAFQTNSLIDEVDVLRGYMVVGEVRVEVREYTMDGKVHQPKLLDLNGRSVPLSFFKPKQRVRVLGHQFEDGRIVAFRIQRDKRK